MNRTIKRVSDTTNTSPQAEQMCNKQVSTQSARVYPSYTGVVAYTDQSNEQVAQITNTPDIHVVTEQLKTNNKQTKTTKNTGQNNKQKSGKNN